jgi:hypothetical protein
MFHITIGTAGAEPPTLEPDLRMTKAALLYADNVKLCSAHYSTWISVLAMRDMSLDDLVKETYEAEEMIPHMYSSKEEIAYTLYANRKARESYQSKNPTVKDILFWLESKKLHAQQYKKFKSRLKTLDLEKAQKEFDQAVKAGLLEIHRFPIMETENIGASSLKGTLNESVQKIADEFTNVVMNTVSDASTYPLFDDGTGSLVKTAIEVGVLSPTPTRIAQGKQTQLAADTLRRLPLFDEASMNEILDIRKELERHLVRFRSAIIKYADKIRNASWDEEFSAEAEETFHRDIESAVLDIEDAVKSNSSLLELATRKLADKPALSTSVFSFIVSQLSSLPTITTMVMAASVGAATAIYDAFKEAQKQQRAVEQNQLYFHYQAGELLTNRVYEYRKG